MPPTATVQPKSAASVEGVTDYYGQRKGTTYLQILSEFADTHERVIHRQLTDQSAYDTWHLSLYMKEVLAYRALMKRGGLTIDDLPRKEKNLLVYLLLAAEPRFKSVLELGSSLFELIDGLELIDGWLAEHGAHGMARVDPERIAYTGVEISDLLNQAADELHAGYDVTLLSSCDAIDQSYDVIYDRNVTSYVFTTVDQLAAFIAHGQVALMNLFLSKGETFLSARLGKSLTYFSLSELVERLDRPLYHLFGLKAPGPHQGADLSMGRDVIEGFFLCGEAGFVERFVDTARSHPDVAAYFDAKEIKATPAEQLVD